MEARLRDGRRRLDLRSAAAAATDFLLENRAASGWWRDFDVAGPSDAWVTAYVASALARAPADPARKAARQAWRLLRRRRRWSAGWGYHGRVPADADSTTWCVRLAEAVGAWRSLRVRRAHRFLRRHLKPCGGLATFRRPGPILRFTRLGGRRFDGWCAAHTCVTAAAAQLETFPSRARLLAHLRERQRADGGWSGYWWSDPEYTTALAAEAMASRPAPGDRERLRRAGEWASGRIGRAGCVASRTDSEGSPFATSCCLRALLAQPEPPERAADAARRCLRWLLERQRTSGSWTPSARLRVPPPDRVDPETLATWGSDGRGEESIGTIVVDQNAIFTTATVLGALHAAQDGLG